MFTLFKTHFECRSFSNIDGYFIRPNIYNFTLLCALFVIFGRVVNIENFSLTVWGDRDLCKGLPITIIMGGPETNSGYRAFGGFFYQLLTFVFSIWADIRAANVAEPAFMLSQ